MWLCVLYVGRECVCVICVPNVCECVRVVCVCRVCVCV